MKRIMKIVVFLVIGICMFLFLNYRYMNTNTYRNKYVEIERFKNVPDNIEILNLGSSHGLRSFTYDDIESITCFNAGLSSQYLVYDFNI